MKVVNGEFGLSAKGHKTMKFTLEHNGRTVTIGTVLDKPQNRWQVHEFWQGDKYWRKNGAFKDYLKYAIGYELEGTKKSFLWKVYDELKHLDNITHNPQ